MKTSRLLFIGFVLCSLAIPFGCKSEEPAPAASSATAAPVDPNAAAGGVAPTAAAGATPQMAPAGPDGGPP